MIEVVTDITTISGSGKVAVHYFDATSDPAVSVAAINNFWTALLPLLSNTAKFTVRGQGRVIDEVTGTLTGFYAVAPFGTKTGSTTFEVLPDAVQGLVQWRTGVVVAGREVRGRTFIPGLTVAGVDDGNLLASTQNSIKTATNALLDPELGFGVWRRPSPTGTGQHVQVSASTVWSELAVLRRRRG